MLNEVGGFIIENPKATCIILALFEVTGLLLIALNVALQAKC